MVKEAGIEPGATAPQGDMCDALTPVPPTPARWPSDGEVKKIWPSWLSKLPIPEVDYTALQQMKVLTSFFRHENLSPFGEFHLFRS